MSIRAFVLKFTLFAGIVVLAACSPSSRVVKTYDGASPADSQVARLETPASIKILSIDGKSQTIYLAKNMGLNYELLPGEHTIVYQYASIWAVPRGVEREDFEENTAKVQNVDSAPLTSVVTLKPGERYIMRHEDVSDLSGALDLARRFSAEIVSIDSGAVVAQNQQGQSAGGTAEIVKQEIRTPGVVAGAGQPKAPLTAPAPVAGAVAIQADTGAMTSESSAKQADSRTSSGMEDFSDAGVSRLDAMKVLWGKASKEDKKAFLRWAFE